MCTSVVEIVRAEGAGKGDGGWFPVTSAVVSYDHPHHALLEEAITIDFVNSDLEPGARAAVEITLESARELAAALARAIAGAEEMENSRGRTTFSKARRKEEGGRRKAKGERRKAEGKVKTVTGEADRASKSPVN